MKIDLASMALGIKGEILADRRKLIEEKTLSWDWNKIIYYEQKYYLSGILKHADRTQ